MGDVAIDAAVGAGPSSSALVAAVELFDLMPFLSAWQRIGYCFGLAAIAGPKGVRRSLTEGPSKLMGIILFLGVLHFLLMSARRGVRDRRSRTTSISVSGSDSSAS